MVLFDAPGFEPAGSVIVQIPAAILSRLVRVNNSPLQTSRGRENAGVYPAFLGKPRK
jgi:hypothetical protein